MIVLTSILLVLLLFSILVLGHEAGHFLMAKIFKLDVQEFGFGFPPRIFFKKIRGTDYSFNAIPLGGFVTIKDLDDDQKARRIKIWKRALIFSGGVIVNLIIGWLALSFVSQSGNPDGVYVTDILPGSPAEAAHILKGDLVYGFKTARELSNFIGTGNGETIELSVRHTNGSEELIKVTPRVIDGKMIAGVELIGPWSGWRSFVMGAKREWEVIKAIYSALYGMVVHKDLANVSGPVGVFTVVKDFGSKNIVYFVYLLGLISINLAIFNILPLPILDGGHIMFLLIEWIFRKPVNLKTRTIITYGSGALLFALMIFATFQDVARLIK